MVPAIVSNSTALEIIQTVRGLYLLLQNDNPNFIFSPAATVFNGLHSAIAKALTRGPSAASPSSSRTIVPTGPVRLYFLCVPGVFTNLCAF